MDYLFFEKIGLSKVQTDIYLVLYKLGTQPASIVAKYLSLERTKAYRNLLKLVKLDLVKTTHRNNIQVFFVENVINLKKLISRKVNDLNYLEKNQASIVEAIKCVKIENTNIPKVTLYDNSEGVSNIFEDILINAKKQKLLTIRIFASNTYEEQIENIKISQYASDFFKALKKERINTDEYIGIGSLVIERIAHLNNSDLLKMPATKSSTNIILVGQTLYFVVYNNVPMGIKIENENLADAFHALLDETKKH